MIKKKINSIILGSSRGIGREIYIELNKISHNIIQCSSKDIDTSNLESVKKFIKKNKTADVLILNTGGPPPKDFYKISEKEWSKYFNQLFLSFTIMLQKIKIKKGGYVFLISSSIIKEPSVGLEISSSLRTGFVSLFKSISLHDNNRNISFVNVAPGPFKTERVKELVTNMKSFEKNLPTGKIGNPNEIGRFVRFVVENNIKYLTGSTVYFDGNINKSII
jgi:3-oxoacyl-[acyl-carrier protein] reductase